jgi:PhnB protein
MNTMQLSPYINFQGRAREAMEFYQSVLGGNLDLETVDEQGATRPAGPGDRIMYSRLDAEGMTIIGVDGYPPTVGDNIAIALRGTDKDRLYRVFSGLAEGGTIKMPLTTQSWGDDVGYLMDKFGISWVVDIHGET